MQYQSFGRRTGLRVSELALGTGNFGTGWGHGSEPAEARQMFDRFAEAGGTFIDRSERYAQTPCECAVDPADIGHEPSLTIVLEPDDEGRIACELVQVLQGRDRRGLPVGVRLQQRTQALAPGDGPAQVALCDRGVRSHEATLVKPRAKLQRRGQRAVRVLTLAIARIDEGRNERQLTWRRRRSGPYHQPARPSLRALTSLLY